MLKNIQSPYPDAIIGLARFGLVHFGSEKVWFPKVWFGEVMFVKCSRIFWNVLECCRNF